MEIAYVAREALDSDLCLLMSLLIISNGSRKVIHNLLTAIFEDLSKSIKTGVDESLCGEEPQNGLEEFHLHWL